VFFYGGPLAHDGALLIWSVYLNSPEGPAVAARKLPSHNLEQWDKALVPLLNP
jgi:hypothetical protein